MCWAASHSPWTGYNKHHALRRMVRAYSALVWWVAAVELSLNTPHTHTHTQDQSLYSLEKRRGAVGQKKKKTASSILVVMATEANHLAAMETLFTSFCLTTWHLFASGFEFLFFLFLFLVCWTLDNCHVSPVDRDYGSHDIICVTSSCVPACVCIKPGFLVVLGLMDST